MSVRIIEQAPEGTLYLEGVSGQGRMEVITALRIEGGVAFLDGLHIDGPGAGTMMVTALRAFARELGRLLDVEMLVIQGGMRTNGANPGTLPRPRLSSA